MFANTLAARRLNLSQPAISFQIQALEQRLMTQLLAGLGVGD